MSHTVRKKDELLKRVRRLRGQLEATERALIAEAPCGDILQLLASMRGALGGLSAEVIEDHLEEHVAEEADPARRAAAAEELLGVIRTYLR